MSTIKGALLLGRGKSHEATYDMTIMARKQGTLKVWDIRCRVLDTSMSRPNRRPGYTIRHVTMDSTGAIFTTQIEDKIIKCNMNPQYIKLIQYVLK